MKHKSLKINAFLNIATTVLGVLFPLVTFPYVSRVLQVETIGIYNFSGSVVSYFFLLARFVDNYAIREGAKLREDSVKIGKFTSEVFSINLVSTIISYGILFLTVIIIPKFEDYRISIFILSTQLIFRAMGALWLCNIFEDFGAITMRSICTHVISLIALFVFVKSPKDLYVYCIINVLSTGIAEIVNFFYAQKKYVRFHLTFHLNLKKHIKPILTLFVTSLAIMIYVSSDTTMIGFLKSDYDVGLYSTAVKIYTIIKNILSAAIMVLIPRFSLLFSDSDRSRVQTLFSKTVKTLGIMVIPAAVGLCMVSREIILLIAGQSYLPAYTSLQILSVATIFSLFACLFTQCILVPMRKENVAFKATLISAITNIGLNFFFIPQLGINGAAVTTIIAEAMVCFISLYYVRKEVSLAGLCHDLLSCLISCLGIVVCCMLSIKYINNDFLRLVIAIVSSICAYLGLLFATRNEIALEMFKSMRITIMKRKDNE